VAGQAQDASTGWKGNERVLRQEQFSADEETYFAMDDNNDQRFNFVNNNIWRSHSTGLDEPASARDGACRDVRALQWAQFLAKTTFSGCMRSQTRDHDIQQDVFGMLVGT